MDMEVAEQVHDCMAPFFPTEAKSLKKEPINCAKMWEFLCAKKENADSSVENSQKATKTEEDPEKETEREPLPKEPTSQDPSAVKNDSPSSDIPEPDSPSKPENPKAEDVVEKVPSEKAATQ